MTPKGIWDREPKMVFMCAKGEHVAVELCPEWWRKVVVSGLVSRRARKNRLQRALSTCLCVLYLCNGDSGVHAFVDYFHIENLTNSSFSFPIPSFLLALFLSPLFTFSFFSPYLQCSLSSLSLSLPLCVWVGKHFFAFLKCQQLSN